jgi:hypothetical protein
LSFLRRSLPRNPISVYVGLQQTKVPQDNNSIQVIKQLCFYQPSEYDDVKV